jgi:hypothetical protein
MQWKEELDLSDRVLGRSICNFFYINLTNTVASLTTSMQDERTLLGRELGTIVGQLNYSGQMT